MNKLCVLEVNGIDYKIPEEIVKSYIQFKQERDKYKSIVEKAIKYINWSLETNEELTDMGIGLCVNNVEELLKILNGAEVKYFDRDKWFAIEVEELEEGDSNDR